MELTRRTSRLAALGLALCLPWLVLAHAGAESAGALGPRPLRIVVDPGHDPGPGGTLGVRGIYEVHYNDVLAGKVCAALAAAGFRPVLTRTAGQAMSLDDRAQLANAQHADLFLSIHHDSAQPRYLEKTKSGTLDAYRATKPIAGYSLFVSMRNPRFAQSYAFAEQLGEAMRKLGRSPALHHAEPIAGENRELLDPRLGIYRFDDLVVLRKTEMPAVLLEVGVIVDPEDEAYVSNEANQQRIVEAIVSAVRRYAEGIDAGGAAVPLPAGRP